MNSSTKSKNCKKFIPLSKKKKNAWDRGWHHANTVCWEKNIESNRKDMRHSFLTVTNND